MIGMKYVYTFKCSNCAHRFKKEGANILDPKSFKQPMDYVECPKCKRNTTHEISKTRR